MKKFPARVAARRDDRKEEIKMMMAACIVVAVAFCPLFLLWNEWQDAKAADKMQALEDSFFE